MRNLFCDCETDEEKAQYFLSGRAWGIAHSIQNEVAMAFQRCHNYGVEVKRLREEKAELVGALEMIAGEQPCDDSLMGNADIARAALEKARNHG